jgi:hypothetical protein
LKADELKEKNFFFNHQEVVEELIKKQGLHEGLWTLILEVGLVGANVNVLKDGKTTLTPSGMVLVQKIGIVKTDKPSDLTVDAAEVNPREPAKSRKRLHKRQK